MQLALDMALRKPRAARASRLACALVAAFPSLALSALPAAAALTERVSVDSSNTQTNAGSTASAVSADGRLVTFASLASNLVPGDTNQVSDVFVHDRETGATERVSVDSSGAQANGASVVPAISGNGQVVAFVSTASNLVGNDTNGRFDVFVHDRATGVTERVSLSSTGVQGTADSISPGLSFDGQRVVFTSSAAAFVAGDTNGTFDIFLRDRGLAATLRVSVAADGTESNGVSLAPRISADGLTIVFHSSASNLVPGDTNQTFDVFAHDLASGATERVSLGANGQQGTFQSVAATPSADGRYVAFNSDAPNLVPGDTNARTDVFVRDRQAGTTERVSVASDGAQANAQSGFVDPPALSADGLKVAFTSAGSNLVAGDTNNVIDVLVRDRGTGETTRASVAGDGTEGNGSAALWPSLSADGSVVVFASSATNLVASDTNLAQDIFARADSCGNGLLEAGEACDAGDENGSGCCTEQCTVAPKGQACDDGDTCTVGDSCAAGECTAGELQPDACLDPFSCERAESPEGTPPLKPGQLLLADVLGERHVRVGGPRGLCTPVDLGGDADATDGPLLACHGFREIEEDDFSPGDRRVSVENRYGVQELTLLEGRRLCVPAGLEEPPSSSSLDAFACYQAEPREVWHQDFSKDRKTSSRSKPVRRPVAFCTPMDLAEEPALRPDAHLVCYRMRDRERERNDFMRMKDETPPETTVHHRFGTERLALLHAQYTCAPSRLLEIDGVE